MMRELFKLAKKKEREKKQNKRAIRKAKKARKIRKSLSGEIATTNDSVTGYNSGELYNQETTTVQIIKEDKKMSTIQPVKENENMSTIQPVKEVKKMPKVCSAPKDSPLTSGLPAR